MSLDAANFALLTQIKSGMGDSTAINYIGDYDPAATYAAGDVVRDTSTDRFFRAKQAAAGGAHGSAAIIPKLVAHYSADSTSSSTTVTVTVPAAVAQNGDIAILVMASLSGSISTPSGWTLWGTKHYYTNAGVSSIYYKAVTDALTFNGSATLAYGSAHIRIYRNAIPIDSTTPIEFQSMFNSDTAFSWAVPEMSFVGGLDQSIRPRVEINIGAIYNSDTNTTGVFTPVDSDSVDNLYVAPSSRSLIVAYDREVKEPKWTAASGTITGNATAYVSQPGAFIRVNLLGTAAALSGTYWETITVEEVLPELTPDSYQGEYASARTYERGQVVESNGKYYSALRSIPTNIYTSLANTPPTYVGTWWAPDQTALSQGSLSIVVPASAVKEGDLLLCQTGNTQQPSSGASNANGIPTGWTAIPNGQYATSNWNWPQNGAYYNALAYRFATKADETGFTTVTVNDVSGGAAFIRAYRDATLPFGMHYAAESNYTGTTNNFNLSPSGTPALSGGMIPDAIKGRHLVCTMGFYYANNTTARTINVTDTGQLNFANNGGVYGQYLDFFIYDRVWYNYYGPPVTFNVNQTGYGGYTEVRIIPKVTSELKTEYWQEVPAYAGFFPDEPLIASKQYNPTTLASYSTTSTTPVDLDATNLSITFTAPASGSVLVVLSAQCMAPAAQYLHWSLRSGTTNISGSEVAASYGNGSAPRVTARIPISGLTPGTSYTYKWASRVYTSGTGATYAGGKSSEFTTSNPGAAFMEVWAT